MTAMTNVSANLSAKFFPFAAFTIGLFVGWTNTASAQAPLDIRVMDERLNRIESQLRTLQGVSVANTLQMPTAPEDTGTGVQTLPTDVASRLQVRVLQLERLVETLTGQVEQVSFDVSQMRAQLQQMSNDVSYRLAVLEQAVGVSAAVAAPPPGMAPGMMPGMMQGSAPEMAQQIQPPVQTAAGTAGVISMTPPNGVAPPTAGITTMPTMPAAPGMPASPSQVEVAGRVEPDLSMPMSSPVQPQPQMAAPPPSPAGTQLLASGEIQTAPVQTGPVNQGNTFGVLATDAEGNILPPAAGAQAAPPLPLQQQIAAAPPRIEPAPSAGPVAGAQIGMAPDPVAALMALPAGTPKEQYDYAFDILRKADYARAESALRMFLETNPTDTLAGNAQYWLGETFYVRGDFEQAAVEFLTGYQTHSNSSKAPDNLLKLGLSMARLGQTDGACTALSRLATEYPDANDTIRRRAQTERARLSCS